MALADGAVIHQPTKTQLASTNSSWLFFLSCVSSRDLQTTVGLNARIIQKGFPFVNKKHFCYFMLQISVSFCLPLKRGDRKYGVSLTESSVSSMYQTIFCNFNVPNYFFTYLAEAIRLISCNIKSNKWTKSCCGLVQETEGPFPWCIQKNYLFTS